MNLTVVILYNFIVFFTIPIVLYFSLFKTGKSPLSEFIMTPLILFIAGFGMAFITSVVASKEKCESFNWITALTNGLKTPFALCITYAIIFLIPDFTFPFMKITGSYANEPVVAYIAQSILLAFSTLPATASVWLSSQKYGCVLSPDQLEDMNRKNAEDLNKSPPDPNAQEKQVTI